LGPRGAKDRRRLLLFDRDAKFGDGVLSTIRELGSEPMRTATVLEDVDDEG